MNLLEKALKLYNSLFGSEGSKEVNTPAANQNAATGNTGSALDKIPDRLKVEIKQLYDLLTGSKNVILADTFGTVITNSGKPIVENIEALIDAHKKGFAVVQCSSDLIEFPDFKKLAKENKPLWEEYTKIIESEMVYSKNNIVYSVPRNISKSQSHIIYFDDTLDPKVQSTLMDYEKGHNIPASKKLGTEELNKTINTIKANEPAEQVERLDKLAQKYSTSQNLEEVVGAITGSIFYSRSTVLRLGTTLREGFSINPEMIDLVDGLNKAGFKLTVITQKSDVQGAKNILLDACETDAQRKTVEGMNFVHENLAMKILDEYYKNSPNAPGRLLFDAISSDYINMSYPNIAGKINVIEGLHPLSRESHREEVKGKVAKTMEEFLKHPTTTITIANKVENIEIGKYAGGIPFIRGNN